MARDLMHMIRKSRNFAKRHIRYAYNLIVKNKTTSIPYVVNEKTNEFSSLFNKSEEMESFIFFTDPHLCIKHNIGIWTALMEKKLQFMKRYVDSISIDFCISGGDWIGNSDTQEEACAKLSAVYGAMKKMFRKHYFVLGNHDTNYQGVLNEGESWTGRLSQATNNNLWFRDTNTKKAYYTFKARNTKFYVFDTGTENAGISDYQNEQLKWFADSLIKEESEHIALAYHIHFWKIDSDGTEKLQPITQKIIDISNAYNDATKITLNGVNYDFANATGKIRFALSGHTHRDYVTNVGTFNVIETLNAYLRDGGDMHFDLCFADYTNNKLHLVRIGEGENRIINI